MGQMFCFDPDVLCLSLTPTLPDIFITIIFIILSSSCSQCNTEMSKHRDAESRKNCFLFKHHLFCSRGEKDIES